MFQVAENEALLWNMGQNNKVVSALFVMLYYK